MPTPDPSALLEHRGFVRALAYGVLGRDDLSDDALQEAYLVALRHPGAPPNRLRSWLGSSGRRRAIDLHRREVTRRRHEAAAAPAQDASPTDVLAERADLGRRMADAVLALEAPYRDALLLRYYESLAPREIAARLSLPVETVRTRIKRGLARLRDVLDQDGRGRERWLSGVGAFLDDAGLDPAAAVRCPRPLALGTLTAILVAASLGGVALWRARATSDAHVETTVSVVSVDAGVAANGGGGGAPPAPPPPRAPDSPAPADSLRGTPKPEAKAAPASPRFEVAVTTANDAPVAGAFVRVSIGGEPVRERTTDERGRAGFDVPANARADVFVKAKGLASRTLARVSTAAWRDAPFPVPLATGGAAQGRVLDAKTGLPIAGARITSAGGGELGTRSDSGGEPSYGTTETGADGRFRLDGLARDWVITLSAWAKGYRRGDATVIVDRGDRAIADDLRLEAGGSLLVTVVDPDGARRPGASVSVEVESPAIELEPGHDGVPPRPRWTPPFATATTAADGRCELVGLPFDRDLRVRAEAPGAAASARASAGPLTRDRPDAVVDLALRRAAGLRVTATGPDGKPVTVVRTLVDDVERGDLAQAVGEVKILDLEPGTHVVGLVAAGLRGQTIRWEASEGQVVERSVRFEVGASIEGVARDDTGAPITGKVLVASATVGGFHPDQEALTDATGRFRIAGLDPDTAYAVSALDTSTEDPTPSELTAPAKDVALRFERRARVVLHAKVPPGGAVPDELLRTIVLADGTSSGDGSGWNDGVIEFAYAGGRAKLAVHVPGYVVWSKEVEVARGALLDLGEVVLDAGASVEGEVVDADGRPIASASVLRATSDRASSTGEYEVEEFSTPSTCDGDGRFRITTLPRRASTVCAWAVGFVPAGVTVDPTRAGAARARIVLHRGGLLRVRLADGKGETLGAPAVTYVPLDARGTEGEPDERASHGPIHEQRVPAGRWRIRIGEASTDVTVEEGSEQDVVVRRP